MCPFLCVIIVRVAVCVDGERGVMRPGQTLVEHRDQGVCYTTQCTHTLDSATGFYVLKASGTNCTARCQPVSILNAQRHAHQPNSKYLLTVVCV